MLANNFHTSTCCAIFELIKFMCFGSTLKYPHKEFLIPRPPRTRTKYNPLPPRSKFNTRPPLTLTRSTRNPRGLICPAQDSTAEAGCETWVRILLKLAFIA